MREGHLISEREILVDLYVTVCTERDRLKEQGQRCVTKSEQVIGGPAYHLAWPALVKAPKERYDLSVDASPPRSHVTSVLQILVPEFSELLADRLVCEPLPTRDERLISAGFDRTVDSDCGGIGPREEVRVVTEAAAYISTPTKKES